MKLCVPRLDQHDKLFNPTFPELAHRVEETAVQSSSRGIPYDGTCIRHISIGMKHSDPTPQNRLSNEFSAYLRQHAAQPVGWYPWSEEAFAAARRSDKPILLSIGYAACHWCHVMSRECFENPQIAELINRWYVPIKVDREERPDIDDVYMRYVVLLTGSGGWPLTVWLTPEREPFFGGTYFPPEPRGAMPGFADLLRTLAELWQHDRARILSSAREAVRMMRALTASPRGVPKSENWIDSAVANAQQELLAMADAEYGGLGTAPKFPQIPALMFLLSCPAQTSSPAPRDVAIHAFHAIAAGGIRDHVGGGIHRYAVDRRWRVPHFEKMLYDQALFIELCTEVYRVTTDPSALELGQETGEFLIRELKSPEGLFWAALDADSPSTDDQSRSEEGATYLWSIEEIQSALPAELAELVSAAWGISPAIEAGEGRRAAASVRRVVPHTALPCEEIARRFQLEPDEVRRRIAMARELLFRHRSLRPRPAVDDLVIACWNAMAVSALVRLARVHHWLTAAETACEVAQKILANFWAPAESRLYRCRVDTTRRVPAFAEDYAALIRALLDLFEYDVDASFLCHAVEIQQAMDARLWDATQRCYRFADLADDLPAAPSGHDDLVIPSAATWSTGNLLRLWLITENTEWRLRLEELLSGIASTVGTRPVAHVASLGAAMAAQLARRIVVTGQASDPNTTALLRVARTFAGPFVPVLWNNGRLGHAPLDSASWTRWSSPDGRPAAFVCERNTCTCPIYDPNLLVQRLREPIVQSSSVEP